MAEASIKEFGLEVATTSIEEYESDIQFDVITMFGVIEHVLNPMDILGHSKRLLKEGGYIVIFTPNFESVAVRIQKENANMIYPGQHLHHFTRTSIEKASEQVGLNVYSYGTKGIDIGDLYAYYVHKNQNEIAQFLYENFETLQSAIDHADCANHMRVILKK